MLEYDQKADIWSAGVTMYRMFTKEGLFRGYDEEELLLLFKDTQRASQVVEERLQLLPEKERKLVSWLVNLNQNARPTAREVFKHEYFK